LINEGSASSSEIVAGAVKANNPNATVIGETTFGTGSTVLSNFGLGDGSSLLLGTELWLTPEGKLIKNQGVRPDVVVGLANGQFPFTPIDNADNETDTSQIDDHQLEWAIHILESGQAGEEHPTMGLPPTRSQ
jgi:carboxyl-terminal processing protease